MTNSLARRAVLRWCAAWISPSEKIYTEANSNKLKVVIFPVNMYKEKKELAEKSNDLKLKWRATRKVFPPDLISRERTSRISHPITRHSVAPVGGVGKTDCGKAWDPGTEEMRFLQLLGRAGKMVVRASRVSFERGCQSVGWMRCCWQPATATHYHSATRDVVRFVH